MKFIQFDCVGIYVRGDWAVTLEFVGCEPVWWNPVVQRIRTIHSVHRTTISVEAPVDQNLRRLSAPLYDHQRWPSDEETSAFTYGLWSVWRANVEVTCFPIWFTDAVYALLLACFVTTAWGMFVWHSFCVTSIFDIAVCFLRCTECRRGPASRILSVCASVCLSIKCVICDKTKKSCVRILIPHERPFTLVLRQGKWLVGGDPFYLKFWVKLTALERNCRFSIYFRS